MNKFTSIGKTALHIFLYTFVLMSFLLCLGCDDANSSQPTPTLDAEAFFGEGNGTSAAPSTPTPTFTTVPTPSPTPAPTGHTHNWQTLFREEFYIVEEIVTVFRCGNSGCDYTTEDIDEIKEHIDTHGQFQTSYTDTYVYYICTCEEYWDDLDELNQHLEESDGECISFSTHTEVVELDCPVYVCKDCSFTAETHAEMMSHSNSHKTYSETPEIRTVQKSWIYDTGLEKCFERGCGATRTKQ